MPKKLDPKWGWKDAGEYQPVILKKGDFQEIATIMGVKTIKDEIQDVIQDVVNNYLIEAQRHRRNPNTK